MTYGDMGMIALSPGLVTAGIMLLVVVLLVVTTVSYNRDDIEGIAEVTTLEQEAMMEEPKIEKSSTTTDASA